ncbi:MAG: prepilin-type N-terminal cleavage/methylation domain-containing protein [Microthrixaceae bacterium]
MKNLNTERGQSGFSLIEMLLAITIGSLRGRRRYRRSLHNDARGQRRISEPGAVQRGVPDQQPFRLRRRISRTRDWSRRTGLDR